MQRRRARWWGHTGLGEGRDHRDRLGWEHPPPGARHLQPHRPWPLGGPHWAGSGHPPPYRATPREPVYILQAGGRAVLMGEDNLIGSLGQLVTTILAVGEPC